MLSEVVLLLSVVVLGLLSMGFLSGGQQEYWLKLAQEDYFLAGGEPEGNWFGDGLEHVGLVPGAKVEPEVLRRTFHGFHPFSGKKLVQSAGRVWGDRPHLPGFDFCFSVDKDVSILWATADSRHRKIIDQAIDTAASEALQYLVERYAVSRVGTNGKHGYPAVKTFAAKFHHHCCRAGTPQRHVHCLLHNIGFDAAGDSRTLYSPYLRRGDVLKLGGAMFAARVGELLRDGLGVDQYRSKDKHGMLRTRGVDDGVRDHYSKRSKEIQEQLGDKGLEVASASAWEKTKANKDSTTAKDFVRPASESIGVWQNEIAAMGARPFESATGQRQPEVNGSTVEKVYGETLRRVSRWSGSVSSEAVLRELVLNGSAAGVQVESMLARFDRGDWREQLQQQEKTKEAKPTPQRESRQRSEPESLVRDHQLGQAQPVADRHVRRAINRVRRDAPDTARTLAGLVFEQSLTAIAKARGRSYRLDQQQAADVRAACNGDRVVTINGDGKEQTLAAIREAYELSGYRVIGAAVSREGRDRMQETTGIETKTVALRLIQLFPGFGRRVKHHAKQLGKEAIRWATAGAVRPGVWQADPQLRVDRNTVLVVDREMLRRRDLEVLLKAVQRDGGRVVLVGDGRGDQPQVQQAKQEPWAAAVSSPTRQTTRDGSKLFAHEEPERDL